MATVCVVGVGGTLLVSEPDASALTQGSMTGGGWSGISYTSTTACVAVDSYGRALTYNGTSWSSSDVDSGRDLSSVSCTSASFCVAVDTSGNALTYNGTSWSSSDVDSGRDLSSVSCTSASFCVAVDTSGHAVIYNGSGWTSTAVGAPHRPVVDLVHQCKLLCGRRYDRRCLHLRWLELVVIVAQSPR